MLTTKIKAMAEHMKVHRKDYHSRRGLDAMLSQRRSLLQYLRRKDFDSYAIVLSRLGLKDNYMKLVSLYQTFLCSQPVNVRTDPHLLRTVYVCQRSSMICSESVEKMCCMYCIACTVLSSHDNEW